MKLVFSQDSIKNRVQFTAVFSSIVLILLASLMTYAAAGWPPEEAQVTTQQWVYWGAVNSFWTLLIASVLSCIIYVVLILTFGKKRTPDGRNWPLTLTVISFIAVNLMGHVSTAQKIIYFLIL